MQLVIMLLFIAVKPLITTIPVDALSSTISSEYKARLFWDNAHLLLDYDRAISRAKPCLERPIASVDHGHVCVTVYGESNVGSRGICCCMDPK